MSDLLKRMLEAKKHLDSFALPEPSPFSMPFRLLDMKVHIAPEIPVIQVRDYCPMTDEFRAEMNAWLIEMFGYKSAIPDGRVYFMQGMKAFAMNPRTAVMINNLA